MKCQYRAWVVRDHVGGFTRFTADIVAHPAGETDIVVLVDNRFDYDRCPLHLEYFDWYHFGGIARPVELDQLGKLWINALKIATLDIATPRVGLTIWWALTGTSRIPNSVTACRRRYW